MTPTEKLALEDTIKRMQVTSNNFYRAAVACGNHAFIEFTGLMNEYIKLCQQSLDQGIDFTACSIHTGGHLITHDYNLNYISEKLECIFGTSANIAIRPNLPS